VWTVDDVARLIEFKKEFLFIFTLRSIYSEGLQKIRSIAKLYKILLYLFRIGRIKLLCRTPARFVELFR